MGGGRGEGITFISIINVKTMAVRKSTRSKQNRRGAGVKSINRYIATSKPIYVDGLV